MSDFTYYNDHNQKEELVSAKMTVTKMLVAVNVFVFCYLMVAGDPGDAAFMMKHGALFVPVILQGGEYYRLICPIFLHFSAAHLFNNMLLLFFMGDVLEREFGKIKFLIFYLLTGICGNLLSVFAESMSGDYAVSAGASGAVFGVLGGLLYLILKNQGSLYYMTWRRMIFFIGYSLFAGYTSGGINNAAHLGGLLSGFVLAILFSLGGKSQKAEDKFKISAS